MCRRQTGREHRAKHRQQKILPERKANCLLRSGAMSAAQRGLLSSCMISSAQRQVIQMLATGAHFSHLCNRPGLFLNFQIRRRCPCATSSQWLLGSAYDITCCYIMVKTRYCSIFPFWFKRWDKTEVKTRKEVGARQLRGLMNNAAKRKSLLTINSVLTDLY